MALVVVVTAPPAALRDATAAARLATVTPRVGVDAGISVPVPSGWHLLRGRLSDVIDPAPRLAIASFPAKLSRQECSCGMPNVIGFPANGAFLFVWEYLSLSQQSTLNSFPRRPRRFAMPHGAIKSYECAGPSDSIAFSEAGRAFQADLYVGPKASPRARAELLSVLDHFRA